MRRILQATALAIVLSLGGRGLARAASVPDVFTVNAAAIADSLAIGSARPSSVVIGLLPVPRPFSLQFPGEESTRRYVIDPYYPYTTPFDQVQKTWIRTGVRGAR